ncbi:MAG TPA: DUF5654 family protein [Candidatus Saccharimonadia bacterium]|nr:DUF5654 family protein [Candidatus Saccharimonadia bacterium]
MPTETKKPVKKRSKHSITHLPSTFAVQTISLATSGFSLVAALAWNSVIQSVITDYVKPYLGNNSGLLTALLYAVVTTLIAVAVGMQLSHIQEKLQEREEQMIELD